MGDEELWKFLKGNKLYDKDYAAFQKQFSTDEARKQLHSKMQGDKLYQGDYSKFSQEFYGAKSDPNEMKPQELSLYQILKDRNKYNKSEEDFNKQFSSPEARKELHKRMKADKLYAGEYEDFKEKFFGIKPAFNQQDMPKGPTFTQKVGAALADLVPGVPALEAAKMATLYEESKVNEALARSYIDNIDAVEGDSALEKAKVLRDQYTVAIGAKGSIDYREDKKAKGSYDKEDAFKDDKEAISFGYTAVGEAYKRLPKDIIQLDREAKGLQGIIAQNANDQDVVDKAKQRMSEIREEMKALDGYDQYQKIQSESERLRTAKRELMEAYPEQVQAETEKKLRQAYIDAFFTSAGQLGQQYGYTARTVKGLTKGLASVANIPRTLAMNNEYGWTDAWGDWVDDVEEAVTPTVPKDFEAPMIEKGELKTERILPKVFGAAVDMGVLIAGTKGLQTVGLGKVALGTSGILNSHNDYYKAAIANPNVTPAEASAFAAASSVSTALLEYVSPQSWLYNKKAFTKSAINNFIKTKSPSQAMKFAGKEVLGENLQESLQMASDKVIEGITNEVIDRDAFEPTKGLGEEAAETLITTTLISAATGGFGAVSMSRRPQLFNEAIELAAQDPGKYIPILEEAIKETQLPGAEDLIQDIKSTAVIRESLPDNLSDTQKTEITGRQKMILEVERRMNDAPEAFQEKYQSEIDQLKQEIDQIANARTEQQTAESPTVQQMEEQPSRTMEEGAQEEIAQDDADPQAAAERVEAQTEGVPAEGVEQTTDATQTQQEEGQAQAIPTEEVQPQEAQPPAQKSRAEEWLEEVERRRGEGVEDVTDTPAEQLQIPQEGEVQAGQAPPSGVEPPVQQPSQQEGSRTKVRGFQERSLAPKEDKPEGFQREVQEVTRENLESYDTMKLKPEFAEAKQRIEREGEENAYTRLIEEDRVDARDQIERLSLLESFGRKMDEANKAGNEQEAQAAYDKINRMQQQISRVGTKSGQASAALAIWNALTPDGTVEFIKRSVNKERGASNIPSDNQQRIINELQKKLEELEKGTISEATQTQAFDKELERQAKSKPSKKKPKKADSYKSKNIKRVSQKIINKLEDLKVDISGTANDVVRVIGAGLWNNSLSIAQGAIKGGVSVTNAIQKAADYIKENFDKPGFNEKKYKKLLQDSFEGIGITDKTVVDAITENAVPVIKERVSNPISLIYDHYVLGNKSIDNLSDSIVDDIGAKGETANTVRESVIKAIGRVASRTPAKIAESLSKDINKLSETIYSKPENEGRLIGDIIAEDLGLEGEQYDKFSKSLQKSFDRYASKAMKQVTSTIKDPVSLLIDYYSGGNDIANYIAEYTAKDIDLRGVSEQALNAFLVRSVQSIALKSPSALSKSIIENFEAVSTHIYSKPENEGRLIGDIIAEDLGLEGEQYDKFSKSLQKSYDSRFAKMTESIVKDRLPQIKDVARRYYADRKAIGSNLGAFVAMEMDIPAETANAVAASVEATLDNLVGKTIQRTLYNELLKQDLPKNVKKETLAERLSRQVNMGALDAFKSPQGKDNVLSSEEMQRFFAESAGIQQEITANEAAELRRLAQAVSKTEGTGFFNDMAKTALMDYYDQLLPPNRTIDEFWSYYYASILQGITTHIINTSSNASNLFFHPVREASNLNSWLESLQRHDFSTKEGWKNFKSDNPFATAMKSAVYLAEGMKKGRAEALNALKRGDIDSKYFEQLDKKGGARRRNPMENLRGSKLISEAMRRQLEASKNPLAKKVLEADDIYQWSTEKSKRVLRYTGRSLAAEDAIARASAQEAFLARALELSLRDKGYYGSQLRDKITDTMAGKFLNQKVIDQQVADDIKLYEEALGEKVPKEWEKMRRREIETEMLFSEEEIRASEEMAREAIFTGYRDGAIAKIANGLGALINSSPALSLAGKPYVPFTRVVGNVVEYMLDHTPVYGFARANGFSVTGLANIAATNAGREGFGTAQMGKRNGNLQERLAYEEQMGRAWFGTMSFLALGLAVLAGGNDEESFVQVTGGEGGYSNYKGQKEQQLPPYTIRIGPAYLNYQMLPSLTIPLTIIGSISEMNKKYPEALRNMSDEEIDIWAKTFANAAGSITNLSFLKSASDLTGVISDLGASVSEGEAGEGKFRSAMEKIARKYGQTASKPLPQNWNMVKQIESLMNPTSYGQKDWKEMVAYASGIEKFGLTNKPNIDIFGEEVKSYPGETMIPYTHWLGIRGKDERWLFLNEHDAVPLDMRNMRRELDPNMPKRKLKPEELYELKILVGQEFNKQLRNYINSPLARKHAGQKDTFIEFRQKKVTPVQKKVMELWSKAKKSGLRAFKKKNR